MSSSSARVCPFCKLPVSLDDLDEHLAYEHPELLGCTITYPSGEVKTTQSLLDEGKEKFIEPDLPSAAKINKPTDDEFALGLDPRKLRSYRDGLIGAVSTITQSQLVEFYNIVDAMLEGDYRLDRDQFFVDLLKFLVVTNASTKSEGESSARLIGIPIGGDAGEKNIEVVVSWAVLREKAAAAFKDGGFRWRRLARYLGPAISKAITDGVVFRQENRRGTSLTQKYGLPASVWPATLSFFAAIKDPAEWTDDERTAWQFSSRLARGEDTGVVPYDGSPTRPGESLSSRSSRDTAVASGIMRTAAAYAQKHSDKTEMMEDLWNRKPMIGHPGLGS